SLESVEAKLKDSFKDVQYIAITVDPKTDNPKTLKAYIKKMKLSSSWSLLTGEQEKIYDLARNTFSSEVFARFKSRGQYAHSEHFYVLDKDRRLRGMISGTRVDAPQKAFELMSQLTSTITLLN
ncbi:MAG: SCO family protein, partial [Bdellovibrionales bacterium]|nr:SCO family protein [Bdellovibrionales bacterium]